MNKLLLSAIAVTTILASGVQAGHHEGKKGMMFEKMDTDKDGKVSRAEAMQKATERFEKADANKDGYITREEMEAMKEQYREHKSGMHESGVKVPHSDGVIKDITVEKSDMRNDMRLSPVDNPKIKTPIN